MAAALALVGATCLTRTTAVVPVDCAFLGRQTQSVELVVPRAVIAGGVVGATYRVALPTHDAAYDGYVVRSGRIVIPVPAGLRDLRVRTGDTSFPDVSTTVDADGDVVVVDLTNGAQPGGATVLPSVRITGRVARDHQVPSLAWPVFSRLELGVMVAGSEFRGSCRPLEPARTLGQTSVEDRDRSRHPGTGGGDHGGASAPAVSPS